MKVLASIYMLLVFTPLKDISPAKSAEIVCTSYKYIEYSNGIWDDWPVYWTSYASESRNDPSLIITAVSEGHLGMFYRIQLISDDIIMADFTVVYDSETSKQKRNEWSDQYVNCYSDLNGDYVYTQGVSLKSLVDNPSGWVDNMDAMIYLWIFSENMAFALK